MKPELNLKGLTLTNHAYERLKERFNIHERKEGLQYCKSALANAKYIGIVTGADGEDSHLYVLNKVAIYINPELTAIKSVVEYDTHGHYNKLKSKIEKMYEVEFRKNDRLERARLKKLEALKLEVDLEKAKINMRMYRTRSKFVREQCESDLIKVNNKLNELLMDVKKIQMNKREIARAMATVVLV